MTPPEFTWTSNRPTQAGWYWYKEPGMNLGEPLRAWVFESYGVFHAHLLPVHGERVDKALALCMGEWAGPVEPPP